MLIEQTRNLERREYVVEAEIALNVLTAYGLYARWVDMMLGHWYQEKASLAEEESEKI